MSLVALAAGVALYALLWRAISRGPEAAAARPRAQGPGASSSASLVGVSWSGAAALPAGSATERLQSQLRILVWWRSALAALLAARRPAAAGAPPGFDPLFALVWAVGGACAVGAAWQAKYHRFAALVLIGGAGLVTCLTLRLALGARPRAHPDRWSRS